MNKVHRQKRRALVLDDEPPFRTLFKLMMALLDWECEVFACPEQARERLKSSRFDVIVTDYHLREGNGLYFICCLRRDGITVPAIVMSGDAQALRLAPKEMLRISAVLLKPFTMAELEAALAKT